MPGRGWVLKAEKGHRLCLSNAGQLSIISSGELLPKLPGKCPDTSSERVITKVPGGVNAERWRQNSHGVKFYLLTM